MLRFLNTYGQVVSFTAFAGLSLVPLYWYSKSSSSPDDEVQLQQTLTTFAPDVKRDAPKREKQMGTFWKSRGALVHRAGDSDFDALLRGGASSAKRQSLLSGPVAERERLERQQRRADLERKLSEEGKTLKHVRTAFTAVPTAEDNEEGEKREGEKKKKENTVDADTDRPPTKSA